MPKVQSPRKEEPAEESAGLVEEPELPMWDGQMYKLVNKDPQQHYVCVNLRISQNAALYRARGYKPVMAEPGNASFALGECEQGKPVEMNGMTLMSRPMRLHQADQKRGDEIVDGFESQMASHGAVRDGGGPIGSVRNRDGQIILGVAHERNADRLRSEMGG